MVPPKMKGCGRYFIDFGGIALGKGGTVSPFQRLGGGTVPPFTGCCVRYLALRLCSASLRLRWPQYGCHCADLVLRPFAQLGAPRGLDPRLDVLLLAIGDAITAA